MNAVLIVSMVLLFAGFKYYTPADGSIINPDYMSKANTNAIKGIFVMLVFFRHFRQYIDYGEISGKYNNIFKAVNSYTGQLIVVMFLFYSGYGLMEAIKKKGKPYVLNLPAQHGLKTLVHFDIAVLLFLILRAVFGRTFAIKRILLSLLGWSAVGNSNWYIFAVVILYLLTFIAFIFTYKKPWLGAVIATLLTVGYVLIIMQYKKSFWYNTALCFPLGLWYSLLKDKIDWILNKSDILYWIFLTVSATAFLWCGLRKGNIRFYMLWTLAFAAVVILISMKITVTNRFNTFLGDHIFSIYILQRIPMIFFSHYINVNSHYVMYFLVCFLSTIVLAVIFDKLMAKFDAVVFTKLKIK